MTSKIDQATVDKFNAEYAKRIALLVVRTGCEDSEFRGTLIRLGFEHLLLEKAVNDAAALGAFDALLTEKEKILVERTRISHEMYEALIRKKAGERKAEFAAIRLEILKTKLEQSPEPEDEELAELFREDNKIIEEVTDGVLADAASIEEGLDTSDQLLLAARWQHLNDPIKEFRRTRKRRRILQEVYRFLLAVFITGIAYSVAWKHLIVFIDMFIHWFQANPYGGTILVALLYIIQHSLKEYFISPWVKRKRFDRERKDLIFSIGKFYQAYFRNTVLFLLEQRRLFKPDVQPSPSSG